MDSNSLSITFSDMSKGKNVNLFEKFQQLQDEIEQREQMMQMAKTKKTPFARAVLHAGYHDNKIRPPIVGSSSMNNGMNFDLDHDTLASEGLDTI